MRHGAYFIFELFAWPALAWCGVELALRAAAGAGGGAGAAALTGACAAGTIVACRWRNRTLESEPARARLG
jgi:hypothetical protein